MLLIIILTVLWSAIATILLLNLAEGVLDKFIFKRKVDVKEKLWVLALLILVLATVWSINF